MKRTLAILTTVALSATIASAELVGSLHLPANMAAVGKVLQSTNNIPTRTSDGNGNTRGTVEGAFSAQAGALIGAGTNPVYTGFGLKTFSATTQLLNTDRFGGGVGGGFVWDFDLSGTVTNAWELKVEFDKRDGDGSTRDAKWYISFTGLGRTLDTTDVTTLAPGDGIEALITDTSKYIYIGNLPTTVAGTNTWDLTEIIEAAQTEGAGLVRVVLKENSYLDDIHFRNDSGLIATDSTSATPVTFPEFYVSDNFETGTGSASTNGVIANGWVTVGGPEQKEYNVGSSGILDIRDAFLGSSLEEGSNTVHAGEFDGVQIQFDPIQLAAVGDSLELSLDVGAYADTSGAPMDTVNSPMFNISLVDSSRTNEAGWGFRAKPNAGNFSKLVTYNSAGGFPQDPGIDSSRTATTTNGVLQTWKLLITRIEGDTFELIPSLDGVLFGGSKDLIVTNATCLGASFDTLTILPRGNDIGVKIDNAYVVANLEPVAPLSPFEQWAFDSGLTNGIDGASDNPDNDIYDNWGEYVLGGDPTNGMNIGVQPTVDASGKYVYTLRNDIELDAFVLTSENLVTGDWTTNNAETIIMDDGELTEYEYTNLVGSAADRQFIKLLVK
ncbi:hypothetical protein P4B35_11385 [Pontiellaceae bacterium B12227]|nr:hypothetical protein [Pontiellaceae bacterium B12227]